MRISDWSSDVCSSDLAVFPCPHGTLGQRDAGKTGQYAGPDRKAAVDPDRRARGSAHDRADCAEPRTDEPADRRARGRSHAPGGRPGLTPAPRLYFCILVSQRSKETRVGNECVIKFTVM